MRGSWTVALPFFLCGCASETILASSRRPMHVTAPTSVPAAAAATHEWVELRGSWHGICGRDAGGKVWCWGATSPRIGGAIQAGSSPVDGVTAVVLGWTIRKNGDVVSWRGPWNAEQADWFHGAVELDSYDSAGWVCARMPHGEVRCQARWMGNNGDVYFHPPTRVTIPIDATALAVGIRHVCALRSDRTVACWGKNDVGQFGDGTRQDSRSIPVVVPGLRDVIQIDASQTTTCAVRSDTTVVCWGQAGEDAAVHTRPTRVPGLSDVAEVAVGDSHLCARLGSGDVVCTGTNERAQLGMGRASNDTGRSIISGLSAAKIVADDHSTCAARSDGAVVCWGNDLPLTPVVFPEK